MIQVDHVQATFIQDTSCNTNLTNQIMAPCLSESFFLFRNLQRK